MKLPIALMRASLLAVHGRLVAASMLADAEIVQQVVGMLVDQPSKATLRQRRYDAKKRDQGRPSDGERAEPDVSADVRSGVRSDAALTQTLTSRPLSALSPSENPRSFERDPEEEEEDLNARASAEASRADARSDGASDADARAALVARATLLAQLQAAYEGVCHSGNPTLSERDVEWHLAPKLDSLVARRPADPVGLFREVVQRWYDGLQARGKAPAPKWFAQDFAAVIDKVPEPAPARRLEIHRLAPPPEPAPEPIEPEEISRLIASALPRRMPA